MKTSKPFSTISYNTPDFLKIKLDRLITERKIDFWAFIHHLPEDDELRPHKHLFIIPNGQLSTDTILDYLREIDPQNIKPLGCIFCKSSKFDDWYLYGLHDESYLTSKGQSRKYHYKDEEYQVSDKDYFNELKHTIDYNRLQKFRILKENAENGVAFSSLVSQGIIPIQSTWQYERAYELIQSQKYLERQGQKTHTPIEPEEPE